MAVTPAGSKTLNGPIELSFGGPFEALGSGEAPKSNFTIRLSAFGRSGSLGVVSTGTKGYVILQGTSYRLPQSTFRQFESSLGPVTNSGGNAEAQLGTRYAELDGMRRFAEGYTRAHAGEVVDVPVLTLFCAAMARARFAEVGGLDERYGRGLFEDDDMGMAVGRRGWRVALARDVFVHHYGGASFSKLPPGEYLRLWWSNRRAYEKKWRARWQPR